MLSLSPSNHNPSAGSEAVELEKILEYLKRVRQIDLTGYKRSSLARLIPTRMQQVGIESYQKYQDYLKQHPDELTQLLNTVFINFTSFFRDPLLWEHLQNQLIPQIIANKAPDAPIRVWSAGCATGEETYSLAILLAEALGPDQFRRRVRLYGTDVDREALIEAQRGFYPQRVIEAVPEALRNRYFEPTQYTYLWRSDLRPAIRFCYHNLIQMPPFPQIDLLLCRNTLMYFNPDIQIRVLVRFHFSLNNNGFLALGQVENPNIYRPRAPLFTAVHPAAKVFTKIPDAHRNPNLLVKAFCRVRD